MGSSSIVDGATTATGAGDGSTSVTPGQPKTKPRGLVRRVDPLEPTGLVNAMGYRFVTGVLSLGMRTVFHTSRADLGPFPEGPVILAPNHRSFLDPIVLGTLENRRIIFMMHAKYYDMPHLNWMYSMSRCIPVETGAENRRALRLGKRVLDAGKALAIFPEGTISPDGEQQPAQPGMAWLARMSGAPVVPIHIGGTREVLLKGSARLRSGVITIRSGASRLRSEFPAGRGADEAFSSAIMADIDALGRAPARR